MKTTIFAAAFLLAAPACVVAQSDAPATGQQDPQAAYRKLAKDFNQAMSAWQEDLQAKMKEAQAAGKRLPRSAYKPPTAEFVGTAQELAQQFAGKDDAVPFLVFILKNASSERNAVKWAVRTLSSDHAEGEGIADCIDYLPKAMRLARNEASRLLDQLADDHGQDAVRAAALMARARMNAERSAQRAIADLQQVAKLSKDADITEEANELLAEIQKLALGAVAPDIVGEDIDGVQFKLSDYRGKVVLLDFWGFW